MPKAVATDNAEGEMLVITQAIKTATKKSHRTISTSVVVAASTAGSSKRATSTKNKKLAQDPTDAVLLELAKSAPSRKSKETVQTTLDALEEETMDKSWYDALKSEFTKPYFKKVLSLVFPSTPHLVYALRLSSSNSWPRKTSRILFILQVSALRIFSFRLH